MEFRRYTALIWHWAWLVVLGVVAGSWAIYGGLKSVAWTDFFTVVVMIAGTVRRARERDMGLLEEGYQGR